MTSDIVVSEAVSKGSKPLSKSDIQMFNLKKL